MVLDIMINVFFLVLISIKIHKAILKFNSRAKILNYHENSSIDFLTLIYNYRD